MKKLAPLWRHPKDKHWRYLFVAPVVAVAVLATIWGVAEGVYQLRVAQLSAAVNEIGTAYVEPHGGVAHYFRVKAPHYLDSFCIDNGPCPQVTKSWLVLVDPKQEAGYIHEAFQKAGFSNIVDLTPGPEVNGGSFKDNVS